MISFDQVKYFAYAIYINNLYVSRILRNFQVLSVEWNRHVPTGEAAAINRQMKQFGFTKFRQLSAVNDIKNNQVNNYINTHFFKSTYFKSM